MNHRIHLTIAFLAAALCDGAPWPLLEGTRRALAACLIASSLLLHLVEEPRPGALPRRVQTPLLLAALAGVALAASASLAVLAIAFFTWVRGARSPHEVSAPLAPARGPVALWRRLPATAPGTAAFVLFALFVEFRLVGPVRVASEACAQALCRAAETVGGSHLELGPTALGLDLALLAFLTLNAGGARPWRPTLLRAALSGAAILMLVLGYATAFETWIEATREFTREAAEEGPGIFAGLVLLCLALAALVAAAGGPREGAAEPRLRPVLALATCCALLFLPQTVAGRRAPTELAGASVMLVQSAPNDDRFEGSPLPSYGYYQNEGYRSFRRWLEAWGCDVRIAADGTFDAADLADVDLVVCITPVLPSPEPLSAYAAAGGAVLVLGDHTPGLESLERLDAFLAPFGLSFEFDSAFPNAPTDASLRAGASPLKTGLRASPDACYGVGGSVRADVAADVLLESRWGVGDLGFADSDALLGNRHYDHGDRLGDLPIVASGSAGGGKVVVVGDTGPFVDSALPFSYPFVRALLEEALTPPGRGPLARGLALLLLVASAAFAAKRAAPVGIALLAFGVAAPWRGAPEPVPAAPGLVAIDASLRPLTATPDRDPRTSIKGFAYQCAVQGRHPAVVDDLRAALAASPEIVVLISPAREPSPALRAELAAYVESGGELWIAVGSEESAGARALLAELGLGVVARPLGSSDQRAAGHGLRYREAWEVVAAKGIDSEPLLETFGHPIVRRVARGSGHVTLFGDSFFLCDDNVGTGEVTHEESERFLAQLLSNIP